MGIGYPLKMGLTFTLLTRVIAPAFAMNVESWTTYQGQALGIEIMAPMHWTEEPGEETYRLFAPDIQQSGATITVSKRPGSLAEVVERGKRALATVLQDGHLMSEKSAAQGGHPTHILTFSATDQGAAIIGTMNFIDIDGQVFLVDCEANKDAYKQYQGTFRKIAASLHEYAKSGIHALGSGYDVPSSWVKHRDNRLKVSAQTPPDWRAKVTQEEFLSGKVSCLRLSAPDFSRSHARVLIASTGRTETPGDALAWAHASIEALPKGEIRAVNRVKLSGNRKAYVIVFTSQGKGIRMAHTLTLIFRKDRILLVLCRADFKNFERYNAVLNIIADSVQEYALWQT